MTMFTRRCSRQLSEWRAEFASGFKIFLTLLLLSSFFTPAIVNGQCNSFNVDFKQAANDDNFTDQGHTYTRPGEIHWIGSILQNSNSRYIEGMSTLQRIVFNNLASCNGTHILRLKMESRKADQHAYDFITSWDNALAAAQAIAPGFGLMPSSRSDPNLHECGPDIGACSGTACNLVTNNGTSGGTFRDLPVVFSDFANTSGPGESNLIITGPPADQNTTRQVIQTYQCRYGARTVRVYVDNNTFTGANGDANNQVVFVGYGDANPNDGGDTYIYYDVKWTSPSPDVVIEYAAHIGVGVDGLAAINPGGCNVTSLGVGYLINHGASSISGGPYHTILESFIDPTTGANSTCEGNLGNEDNQLQGSEILLIPSCTLTGPGAVCSGATGVSYSANILNTESTVTYAWSIILSNQTTPANISTGQGTAGPITVNAGSTGHYTVQLIVLNGGTTQSTDDDIADTCTFTTNVNAGPTITCPTAQTTAACQTQAQVDAAFTAWLAGVSATGGTATNNGGTSGPDKCGGSKTVIFTVSNTCGTSTCSSSFTVTAPPPISLNCPTSTTTGSCQTQAAVDAAFTTWLGTASASGGCNGNLSNNGGTAGPDRCGGTKVVTFTYTSSCATAQTCTASFTVSSPPAASLTCPTSTTTGSCQTQAAVDAAFTTWLATASSSGGCNGSRSNNGGTAGPDRCGGTKVVTFTYTSSCAPATTTCTASFTVAAPPTVSLHCPDNTTVGPFTTQAQADAAFTAWLAQASGSGGCNGNLSNNNNGAPNFCGGSKTVTFTYTSSCAPATTTCAATFTITGAATAAVTCPTSTTTSACQTQAQVDAAFTAWLATASGTGGTVTNNGGTTGPDKCGGTKTVTFSVTNACGAATCAASFTVPSAPPVSLVCPTSTTTGSCQTQAAVDAAFTAWLATASSSGGCNGTRSNNGGTSGPDRCGGTKVVTFTYTSSCAPATTTCSASFTVTSAPAVSLVCPTSTTTGSCQTQAQVDAAFTAWLATATSSGGCNGGLSNNGGTSGPDKCGGTKVVTFTYTSTCAPATTTCSASFTVTSAPAVSLVCPTSTTTGSCQTQAQVDAAFTAWLATATSSGGCNGSRSNNGGTAGPDRCGGSKTVTFTYTSTCAPLISTCTATFTVTAPPTVSLHCPDPITVAANQTQAQVDAAFTAWLASATGSGGCNGGLSNSDGSAPDHCAGGTKTVTFTYTSSCAPTTTTCSSTFTVPAGCVNTLCTYTQGYYGNAGGTSCDGAPAPPNTFTTAGLIAHSLAYWGGSLTVGCAGHSVTINNNATDIACLIDVMPGNTSPKVLPAGDFGICSLPTSLLKNGKIANVLLGQTIALGLNIGVQSGTLGTFALDSNKYLVTADVTACGSNTLKQCQYSCVDNGNGTFTYTLTYSPYHVGCKFSGALIKVLHDFYTQDVLGLYHLANDALCGSSTHGISLTDINNALDCINNAFDGCRSFVNWSTDGTTPCPPTITNTTPCPAITTAARPIGESVATASNLKVIAYPNPFTSVVKFTIQSAVSGEAQLEVYNQLGQKVSTIYRGYLQAHRSQVVEYKAPRLGNQLIYILRVGGQSVTGKLLHLE